MNPTRETIAQLARKVHDPKLAEELDVLILRDDGQLCSTAGGELFGARSQHILSFGVGETFDGFPEGKTGKGVCVLRQEDADRIIEMIDQVLASEGIDANKRRQGEKNKNVKRMLFDMNARNVLETMDELIDCFEQYIEYGEVRDVPQRVEYGMEEYNGDEGHEPNEEGDIIQPDVFTPQQLIQWFKKTAKSFPGKLSETRELIISDLSG